MEAQKRQFLILAVLLAAFAALFLGLRAWQERQAKEAQEAEESETITVATLDMDQATAFSYLLDGQELSFEKEEGVWHYSGDESIPLSQSGIDTMLGNLSEVKAQQKINAPENPAEYGFEEPTNVISVQFGQEKATFTIGMYNSVTGQYYLMADGNKDVYLVDSQITLAFRKSVEDLTESTKDTGNPAESTKDTGNPAESTEE